MTKPDLTPQHALEVVERVASLTVVYPDIALGPSDRDALLALARYGAECLAAREAWTFDADPCGCVDCGSEFAVYALFPDWALHRHGDDEPLRRVLILPPEPREEGGKG